MSSPTLNEMITNILSGGETNSLPVNDMQGGGSKMMTVGSRAQVMHDTAMHTSGGLTKSDLMYNKHGRIVSKKKHSIGLKAIKTLKKMGYSPKKGSFKLFSKKRGSKKSKK